MKTPAAAMVFTVTDRDARIRTAPPEANWTGKRIPMSTRVDVLAREGSFSRVEGVGGKEFGWTATSNLTAFFKDHPDFAGLTLTPSQQIAIDSKWSKKRRAMVATHNRIGGGLEKLARVAKIEAPACLAVWYVESGGRVHKPGQAVIRFENHHLFRYWGDAHPDSYDQHFQHGGRRGVSGKPWLSHQWREKASGKFEKFHGNQTKEYTVLGFAETLASKSIARKCISIGGTQILCSNHNSVGYSTVNSMYDAFQESEMAQVIAFFDFCYSKDLIKALRQHDWTSFARGYNGSGQEQKYGEWIGNAYKEISTLFR